MCGQTRFDNVHTLYECIMELYGKILQDFMNNHEGSRSLRICNITFQRGSTIDGQWVNLQDVRSAVFCLA